MELADLPRLNASLNATATVFIVAGLVCIKTGRKKAHAACMATALTASAAFLTSYLIYHFAKGEPTPFTGTGAIRTVYFVLLFSPHRPGCREPSDDHCDGGSGAPGTVRQTQADCPLDLACLALRVSDRNPGLFLFVRLVSRERGMTARRAGLPGLIADLGHLFAVGSDEIALEDHSDDVHVLGVVDNRDRVADEVLDLHER